MRLIFSICKDPANTLYILYVRHMPHSIQHQIHKLQSPILVGAHVSTTYTDTHTRHSPELLRCGGLDALVLAVVPESGKARRCRSAPAQRPSRPRAAGELCSFNKQQWHRSRPGRRRTSCDGPMATSGFCRPVGRGSAAQAAGKGAATSRPAAPLVVLTTVHVREKESGAEGLGESGSSGNEIV